MKEVMDTLRKLEAASGNQKLAILRQHGTALFQEIARATYDPYVTYGVKDFQMPVTPLTGQYISWERWKNTLVRLASRELSGSEARRVIRAELSITDPAWRDVIRRVLLRDLECGVQATSLNKVFPGLIPTFSVSLAKTLEWHRFRYPVGVERKEDGKRIIAVARLGEPVVLYSRNGLIEHGYPHINNQLQDLTTQLGRDAVYDGELMFGMFGDRKAKAHEAEYIVFEVLNWDEWVNQRCVRPWTDRYSTMCGIVMDHELPEHVHFTTVHTAHSREQIEMIYRNVVDNGGEGVMVKDLNAPYVFKRGYHWMKLKPEESEDLKVIDVFEGEGKYQRMLGGIVVDFKGVQVRVGSGFSDAERKKWWNHIENGPTQGADGKSLLIGQTAEVLYTEKTPDGSLRFPRFKCWRYDK